MFTETVVDGTMQRDSVTASDTVTAITPRFTFLSLCLSNPLAYTNFLQKNLGDNLKPYNIHNELQGAQFFLIS
jgi:hypothetical protein